MKKNTLLKTACSFVMLLFAFSNLVHAQNAVDSWTITSTPATDQDMYTDGGDTYSYGQGNNIEVTSVTYNGNVFTIPFPSQSYIFRRVDITPNSNGTNVVGNRASIFFERTGASNFVYAADLPGTPGAIELETILKSAVINRGALDVFKNTGTNSGDEGPSNIERIDVVYPSITINNAPDLALNGFLASEKSGNNTYKMAAILSVDGSGNPTSYGNLVTIQANTSYGIPTNNSFNPARSNAFIEDSNNNNQPVLVGGNNERIGISLITFADLGITVGQTFYGVSLFGDDVIDTDNLLDPTTFPQTTTTGADIYGGLGALVTATGFDPLDDDGDGVSNTNDICNGFDDLADNDGDLVPDGCDLDDDNDGILDSEELSCSNATENISASAVNSSIDNIALHDGTSTEQTLTQAFTTPGCPPNQDIISYQVSAFPSQMASNTTVICADVDSFTGVANANGDNIALDKSDGCDGGIRYRIEFTSGAEIINLTSLSHGNLAADEAVVITADVPLTGQSFKRASAGPSNLGTNGGPTITGNGTNSIAFDNVSGPFGGNLNIWEVSSNGIPANWVEIDYYRSSGATQASYESFTLNHTLPCDNDCDSAPNYLDLDSDNDGIPDTVEAQQTGNYNAPGAIDPTTGIPTIGTDIDGIEPINTDGTDNPDYLDLDSDNDGLFDIIETNNASLDTDNDGKTNDPIGANGLTNTVDNGDDYSDPDGTVNDPTTLPNTQNGATAEVDFRESPDSDNDGIIDSVDLDDDNDGIPDLEEGNSCIITTDLNSPGNATNTNFAAGPTSPVTLIGLDNGTFDFSATVSGTANWNGGIQIQNNAAIGDFIYGQPENTDNSSSANVVTYTFDFPTPVKDFSFVTGGLNNNDQVTITAFIGGTPINITPANFSGLDNGVFAVGNTVQGTIFDNSFDPLINVFTTFIPGAVDQVIITSGKADNLDTQVTIGLYSFSYCSADPTADFDGDGIPNVLDLDSDNDGILDIIEAGGTDSNRDGEVDYPTTGDATSMVDTNMNGLDDGLETTPLLLPNSDAFGGPNYLDIDADDDGIPDNVEAQTTAGYIPPSGTGLAMTDANTNGVDDAYETAGTIGLIPVNTDASLPNSDTLPDYTDEDSDGDGINDVEENGDTDNAMLGVDGDGDGLDDAFDDTDDSGIAGSTVNDGINTPDASNLGDEDSDLNSGGDVDYRDFADHDGDGVPDSIDLDNDNDGIPDIVEGTDDFDNDGIPNYLDLDADNDGIPDVVEAGGTDNDRDGIMDNFTDADNDGLNDAQDNVDNGSGTGEITTGTPLDVFNTDGNGNADYLDIDADDDGIADNIEAQTTGDYMPPLNADDDMDGIDNQYDIDFIGTDIYGIANTDGDPLPDYRDLDSDADTINDVIEGWDVDADGTPEVVPANADADGDGLDDNFDNDDADPDPTNGQVPTDFPDAQSMGGDRDWRQGQDNDGDGILDVNDIDDDNDGILDTAEGGGDTDGDGIPDWFDLDSDNDGIPDIVEAGGEDADVDGDGEVDYPGFDSSTMVDANNNGLEDRFETDPLEDLDSDDDGIVNRLDLDSDNDGIPDVTEAGGTDTDGDGIIDGFTDVDGDGFADSVDSNDNTIPGALDGGTPYPYPNNDSDAIADWLDVDSDNDGLTDVTEAGGIDADNDGRIDGFTDSDMDGFADSVDRDDSTTPAALDGTGAPLPSDDFDNDGRPNYLDIDSDNDGITDTTEAGGADTDGNGEIDGFTDADANGFDDATEINPLPVPNTDGSLIDGPDYLDIDADNDGLPDNIEAQPTVGYVQPNGTSTPNGLDTAYSTGLIPEDTDGDLIPDYLDSDSDNDEIDDLIEGGRGTLTNSDTDGDGLDDGFEGVENNDPFDVNDEIDDPTALPDVQVAGGDVDYRQGFDTDGDGVLDDQEVADGTDPNNPCNYEIASITEPQAGDWLLADCDGDGVTNEQEIADGTNPEDACDFSAASVTLELSGDYLISDCDGDGVINGTEITDGTNPEDPCDSNIANVTLERTGDWLLADCDGDTIPNGQEIIDGTLPDDPCSSRGGTPPVGVPCDITIETDMVAPSVNNGIFQINNIENFPNNTVRIYNRWGVLVFEAQGYDNGNIAFRGISNGRATISENEALPVGVYFYIIEYTKNGTGEVKNGYLYVNR